MNIVNLQIQLQTAIENASAQAAFDLTSDTVYYLQLAKAIQSLNMGQIRTVTTFGNLPAASTHEGWLIFVEADERLYFSDSIKWIDIKIVVKNSAWAWGCNSFGRLGDNTTTTRSSPVSVVSGFTDWCQVAAGGQHSLAIRKNSTAWAWGYNSSGRLGDNTVTTRSSPVSVAGGFTDWHQVSGGNDHSIAVRQNGTAWAWGLNGGGRLGDDTATNRSSPVSVVGGFTDWCQVSGGFSHSLAVRQNGTAWAWGANGFGRLGDNTTTARSSPVSVVGGFTDWCQVSAGYHSIAVRQNGTAWAWGLNGVGQLGDDSITSKNSPVSVVGEFTDWCQVSTGCCHSVAVRQNGTAWAWGLNNRGQLGDDTITNISSPVSVVGGFTDWCQVSTGNCHSLAVRQNGTAWAWGLNGGGRLGDNSTIDSSSPVSVVGGFTDWCQVSGGCLHSLGLRDTST